MTFRIAITGPESTGKSTLAAQLAEALHCPWRPEAARTYLEALNRPYTEEDLYRIHQTQQLEEQILLQTLPETLVLDTEAIVLRIWSEEKYGRCDVRILNSLATDPPDFYLLTGIDTPWEPDPLREHPHPTDRLRLWRTYQDALIHSGISWVHLTGPAETRLRQAVQAARTVNRD